MERTENIVGLQLVAELSRSERSVVYKAHQKDLQRFVLVKVLFADTTENFADRMREEARLLARLSHPNVPIAYSFESDADHARIITEFVDGLSLRSLINREGGIPETIALYIAKEVAEALAAAHSAGVIHRDVEPSNILVSHSGAVKLTDFGLASVIGGEKSGIRGTAGYVAPEVLLGIEASKSADQFSLGAVLYEMLIGEPPFLGEAISDKIDATVNVDPIPRLRLLTQASEDAVIFCSRLLEKKPAKRFQTTALVVDTIDSLFAKRECSVSEADLELFMSESSAWVEPELPAGAASESPMLVANPISINRAHPVVENRRTALAYLRAKLTQPGPARLGWQIGLAAAIVLPMLSFLFALPKSSFLTSSTNNTVARSDSTVTALPIEAFPGSKETVDSLRPSSTGLPEGDDASTGASATLLANRSGDSGEPNEDPELLQTTFVGTPTDTTTVIDTVSVSEEPDLNDQLFATTNGYVVVSVVPWAHLSIDESPVGTTPLTTPLELAPGDYVFRFENPDFPSVTRSVRVAGGETQNIELVLWQTVNRVFLNVVPWAEVLVDGVVRDTVPPQKTPLVLAPGVHGIVFRHPSLGTQSVEHISVGGSIDTVRLNMALPRGGNP